MFFKGDQSLKNLENLILQKLLRSDNFKAQVRRLKQMLITEDIINDFLFAVPETKDSSTNSVFDMQSCPEVSCKYQFEKLPKSNPIETGIQE